MSLDGVVIVDLIKIEPPLNAKIENSGCVSTVINQI